MKFRYRIMITESERGWGQKSWYEYFDTPEEAQKAIDSINADNTATEVPDWYMVADTKIVVEKV